MCGACGTGLTRPPWEAVLGGNTPADRRRRAAAAGRATDNRVKVEPWGAAGYLVAPRGRMAQPVDSLDSLVRTLVPYQRLGLPHHGTDGSSQGGAASRPSTSVLTLDVDRQVLVVWAAFAAAVVDASTMIEIGISTPDHAGMRPFELAGGRVRLAAAAPGVSAACAMTVTSAASEQIGRSLRCFARPARFFSTV